MSELELPDGDYTLLDGKAWFTVGDKSIFIWDTGDRLRVEVYELHNEADDPIDWMEV